MAIVSATKKKLGSKDSGPTPQLVAAMEGEGESFSTPIVHVNPEGWGPDSR